MKRALIYASVASMIDKFNMDNIQILIEMGYKVDVACNFHEGNVTSSERVNEFKNELKILGVEYYDIPIPRSLYKVGDILNSINVTEKLFINNNYDLVHCHTPIASVICRLVARKHRQTKVLYTAHGFHFYKGAPKFNWLTFYPIERICAKYTDTLITINKEDFHIAKKFQVRDSVKYVHGVGVNLEKFKKKDIDRDILLEGFGIKKNDFLIISVGQLSIRKNHSFVIESLAKIPNKKIKYIIIGEGELHKKLQLQIDYLNLQDQVFLLGFKNNISDYLSVSDLFILPSLQEGLPVSLMEAMCSSLPSIVTNIRGSSDLIIDGRGGFTVEINDIEKMVTAIEIISKDDILADNMGNFNYGYVRNFDSNVVIPEMKSIYEKYL